MSTREEIIQLGDHLIREKGFNAFSFYDISKRLKIKNASVHYHFPTKSDLGQSILKNQTGKLEELIERTKQMDPVKKLNEFLSIYNKIKSEGRVCLVGSLATDLNTVDAKMQKDLKAFAARTLEWVTHILEEGRQQNVFSFTTSARTKALLIITNMLAALQLSRLTGEKDFYTIRQTILKELKA
ncbi:MAG: TetR/AcrR family transcriptional regulator [Bacteroidetes bacterium]|nr:TetR/AcrR family transcriptional regulator [Bacteroidota bacterium]